MRSAPEWQAYVEAGATREQRQQRLVEVPEEMRERVRGHVETVFEIRARATKATENQQ